MYLRISNDILSTSHILVHVLLNILLNGRLLKLVLLDAGRICSSEIRGQRRSPGQVGDNRRWGG